MARGEGWICLKCGVVHAPWVPRCTCTVSTRPLTITTPRRLPDQSQTGDPLPDRGSTTSRAR